MVGPQKLNLTNDHLFEALTWHRGMRHQSPMESGKKLWEKDGPRKWLKVGCLGWDCGRVGKGRALVKTPKVAGLEGFDERVDWATGGELTKIIWVVGNVKSEDGGGDEEEAHTLGQSLV